MHYQNRQPEEGINVTKHNAVLHFLKLIAMATVCIVLLVVVLNFIGASVAKRVPFRYESALMERVDYKFGEDEPQELIDYLNQLSAGLAEHLEIPPEMGFHIHYDPSNVFNAYATLGGNLVFHRKLLQQMPNENALAMVMAHEMSHVIHRDPLASMSGGIASMLALMMVSGSSGGGLTGNILTQTGTLTQLTFSRDMETEADRAALGALAAYYGHVDGADTLFQLLNGSHTVSEESDDKEDTLQRGKERITEWLGEFGSTHPQDQKRIDTIKRIAVENEWSSDGELTELPVDYLRWLSSSAR